VPGFMRKVFGGKYEVVWGGEVVAKGTSKANAQKQLNLLRGLEHGWKPDKVRG